MSSKLPIELVTQSNPPIFRWKQTVFTVSDTKVVTHTASLPTQVEGAVMRLIHLCESQIEEIERLKKQIDGMADRIVAQSELLTKQTEKPDKPPQPQVPTPQPVPQQPQTTKRGK